MMMSMEKRPVFRGAKAQAAETPSWTAPTWQELVRDHSTRVYRLAYRLTGDAAATDFQADHIDYHHWRADQKI